MDASSHSGTVNAGDVELAYLRIGEGTPLVVLPGGPRMGYAHMRAGFDGLADVCELVYYDERGSGASPLGNPDGVSTAGTLADLDALTATLALEQPMLIGHSLAAYMVALYAATRTDRIRALVLANPGPPLVPELMERFGQEMASRRPPADVDEMKRIEASAEYEARDPATLERYFRLRYGPFFRDRANAPQRRLRVHADHAQPTSSRPGRIMSDFRDHDPLEKLRAISCPTLVVHVRVGPDPDRVVTVHRRCDSRR